MARPSVAVILDGAQEARALAPLLDEAAALAPLSDVSIVPLTQPRKAADRKKRPPPKVLASACAERDLVIDWAPYSISADLIIWHDPALLAEGRSVRTRMIARHLVIVTHSALTTADGRESYDLAAALDAVDAQVLSGSLSVQPGRPGHRETLAALASTEPLDLTLDPQDWSPTFTRELLPPHTAPSDKRGRVSPARLSAFPDRATLATQFPAHAALNLMLGADWLADDAQPAHWTLFSARDISPRRLLADIDICLHYLHPRAPLALEPELVDAVAAGCLVVTDPDRAALFGDGLVAADPNVVDAAIAPYLADPDAYAAKVTAAQRQLSTAFGAERAQARWDGFLRQAAA